MRVEQTYSAQSRRRAGMGSVAIGGQRTDLCAELLGRLDPRQAAMSVLVAGFPVQGLSHLGLRWL